MKLSKNLVFFIISSILQGFCCCFYLYVRFLSSANDSWVFLIRKNHGHAAFRLACRLPHCHFDDDICTTAQAPLAAEGWPSSKWRLANRSITLPLCPLRQIADSWILFNSGVMPLGDKAKVALPLRAATLKQQAMIKRRSGKAASDKLVWNQHKISGWCKWQRVSIALSKISCKQGEYTNMNSRKQAIHSIQQNG